MLLKTSFSRVTVVSVVIASLIFANAVLAQQFSSSIDARYRPYANVTYLTSGDWEGKLDIYSRTDIESPLPTLVWLHGGSVNRGHKESQSLNLLPYLEQGWHVVNVEHRLPGMTIAPAALNNTLCALRWIHQNADQYGFDVDRIVISGASSGGWFAVAAALTPKPAGWDASCPGVDEPAVAAVVNWYGNWDLADVLQGPNAKTYAPGWVRGSPEPMAIARSLSPLPIGDRAVPPVVSIHGDADSVVPYTQSVRLHEALKAAGIDEKLITIPNGGHGRFTTVENQNAYEEIRAFLSQQGIE